MSLVSANDISQIHQAKKDIRKEIYRKILEQFSKKIKYNAQLNQTSASLMVPVVVVGYPTFDRPLAATYLERQLRNGGYVTRRLNEVTILVHWGTTVQGRKVAKKKQEEDSFGELDGLVNLRKVANKYRK